METKPSDFFLGVIEFIGLLVPGGVLALLHGKRFLELAGIPVPRVHGVVFWVALAAGSYVLGHLLVAAGEYLDERVFAKWDPRGSAKFERRLKSHLDALTTDGHTATRSRTDAFHRVVSYLALSGLDHAVAEIERRAADYKLFRSLWLVSIVHIVLLVAAGRGCSGSTAATEALSLLLLLRSFDLRSWRDRIAFEYAELQFERARWDFSGPGVPKHLREQEPPAND